MKNEYVFWDEQWQENTESKTNTNGGAPSPTDSKENDSKES